MKERGRGGGEGREKKRVRLDYQVVTVASSHDNYWSKVVKWFSSVRTVLAIGPGGEKNHLPYFFLDTRRRTVEKDDATAGGAVIGSICDLVFCEID